MHDATQKDYVPQRVEVSAAESWMDRPIKVALVVDTPTGSNSTTFYLDESEARALVDALEAAYSQGGAELEDVEKGDVPQYGYPSDDKFEDSRGGRVMDDATQKLVDGWRNEMRHLIGARLADADPDDLVPDDLFDSLAEEATKAALAVLADALEAAQRPGSAERDK